ncbi:hypothetical protein, partial [Pseudonocardia pini]|uniref:hypothetical protein n=1 Tax=Pseudonocardia pini TaxID=2758030 RepID=UPI0015F00A51
MTGVGDWTGCFVRSALAPTVFEIAPGARPAVREWLGRQACAAACSRDPHLPAVDAWAVLDGGVLGVAHWRPTAQCGLPSGLYIVGFGAFRLVTAEIGLARPTRPL